MKPHLRSAKALTTPNSPAGGDMMETILFVDDDLRILATFEQALRRQYQIQVAGGARKALDHVLDGRVAIVVSDLNMPDMDGITFLGQVKLLAPRSIGILLTGWADLETAIDALNAGHIFRFLRKPCPLDRLRNALDAALNQYRLNSVEKDFLGDTLIGTLGILMDVLSQSRPEAFGRTARIQQLMRHIAKELNVVHVWELEAAGLLSQLGCISVSSETLKKHFTGNELTLEERRQVLRHPKVGAELVGQVSRLGTVAKIIEHQADAFKEMSSGPAKDLKMMMGAQMLKVATDFDRLLGMGISPPAAVGTMRGAAGEYNPQILEVIDRLIGTGELGRGLPHELIVSASGPHPLQSGQ